MILTSMKWYCSLLPLPTLWTLLPLSHLTFNRSRKSIHFVWLTTHKQSVNMLQKCTTRFWECTQVEQRKIIFKLTWHPYIVEMKCLFTKNFQLIFLLILYNFDNLYVCDVINVAEITLRNINQLLLQLKWPFACLWVLERFLTIYSREIRPGAVSYTIEAHSNDLFTIEHRLTSKIWAQHTERSYVSDINFI
jgi:hypothetical protein